MLIEKLLKVALLGSEWVLYLLIALSILSFSTMLERFLFFKKRKVDVDGLRSDLAKKLDADDIEGVTKLLDQSRSFEARVVRAALRFAPGGTQAMNDAADSELARVKKELERGLNLLGTLGNNAPFVGLLGTVLGVIIAFHALGSAGQNQGQMGNVMAGIAEALVATGVGLFVALPAVVAYNVIQKRIADIETDTAGLLKLLTAYVRTSEVFAGPAAATASTSSETIEEGGDEISHVRGNGAANGHERVALGS
jgi:biopolymer transport protein ExbB/TolQ